MIFKVLLLAVFSASGAVPDGVELLRRAAEAPERAYRLEGTLTLHGRKRAARRVVLSAGEDGELRRDVLGETLVVSNGLVEWLYVPARKRAWKRPAADPFAKRFGPDEELDRLAENYDVKAAQGEDVAGQPAWKVELSPRQGGAVQRRLWLDKKNGIVLRSETLRPDGSLASSMVAERLSFEKGDWNFSPPAGTAVTEGAEQDYLDLDEAEEAAGFAPRLPSVLPKGYVLESVDVIRRGKNNVVHSRFTDGLNVLSLFQAPPKTRLGLKGRARKPIKVAGAQRALTTWTDDGNVVGWTSRGERFILVGALPVETLRKTAESVK
jgi:outer membrane lipoprotein-sorting protein